MPPPYGSAAPKQLHTLLPGLTGAHACLTLYDVCPHNTQSTNSQLKDPYLHCDLPLLPHSTHTRAVEYVDRNDKDIFETTHTTLAYQRPKEKPMALSLAPLVLSKHSPVMRHIRESTAAPPIHSVLKHPASALTLSQDLPTIYIITFSTDICPSTHSFASLLNTHLPPRIPLLYTIDARSIVVPPRHICENYSGVAPVLQEEVMRDRRAREEISHAVEELLLFVRGSGTRREVSLAVCCTAGTHRSVAIAELIALGVRKEVRRMGSREGLKVVVRHIHRVKGVKDPY